MHTSGFKHEVRKLFRNSSRSKIDKELRERKIPGACIT